MKYTPFIYILFLLSHIAFSQVAEQAEDVAPLLIGEKLSAATLVDVDGKEVQLFDLLVDKPTVLVFYRGGWCPYCNQHLSALAEVEDEIAKLGYQVIAVTPDDYKNLQETKEQEDVKYTVLSDAKMQFIEKTGIAFKANERTYNYIQKKTKGIATKILPVPTLMVVNKEGVILFEHISPNYKKRIQANLLLSVLKTIEL